MNFEYDLNKSMINYEKHGVSLKEASVLWFGPNVTVAARTMDEIRYLIIGKINGKFYSCVYTKRGVDTVRLISARRSRKSEETIYYDNIKEK